LAGTGSGFFISECGMAVTNHHVINGAVEARIFMNGVAFEVTGIFDYSWQMDLAVIQVDGGPFRFLELGDSENLMAGASVYALGSPLGLQSTFTSGIVSSARREIEGFEFIQTSAPVSFGSSGGPLMDASGRVVGVTAAGMAGGQNLNFAVPIDLLFRLTRENYVPLQAVLAQNVVYYRGFYPLPSFGAFAGVRAVFPAQLRAGTAYSYLLSDLPQDPAEFTNLINGYRSLLGQHFFSYEGIFTRDGRPVHVYYNFKHNVLVMFGTETFRNREVFTVFISG
jgi:hypothetical protein